MKIDTGKLLKILKTIKMLLDNITNYLQKIEEIKNYGNDKN